MNRPLIGLTGWRVDADGADVLTLAAELGADGVQLDLGGPGRGAPLDEPGRIRRIRETSAATGVRVLGVAVNLMNDIGLTSADPGVVRRTVTRALDAARELEAPLVFVPSFRRSAITGPASLSATAEVLRWASAEAAARGLLLANENVLDVPAAERLLDQVGAESFRLLLDTANPHQAGVDVAALVAALGDRFADQIHVKDGGDTESALAAVRARGGHVRALVLENDHRDGDRERLRVDLARLRGHADTLTRRPSEARP
ncbi:sugar phosphate isomerase/epimerase [Saccharopolyspora sp. 6V]|uniref:sugar phosphate isomerase/epimerase family protein n=1 Tax=Saccharopolyspora sp. 6V TaxID=2877239 RepID=UPI001CD70FD1|nr:TIM barrel protein [Saccharopolyspora sp. 6V]MCA1195966.1 sugar phosphate isomerase/epimerase [Saccharopolyspora sp. 6V]